MFPKEGLGWDLEAFGIMKGTKKLDAAKTLGAANVVGPLYSAVGRTWQQTAEERKKDVDLLVSEIRAVDGVVPPTNAGEQT